MRFKLPILLVVDVVNPLVLSFAGNRVPQAFFTRKQVDRGNVYTRFRTTGAFDENGCQEIAGWYDEIESDGTVKRKPYAMKWRPIFRYELELMLESAGLQIASLEGGHSKEPFAANSGHMFVIATKNQAVEANGGRKNKK